MDGLLLFTATKKTHIRKQEYVLKALLQNGLKISLKKDQLFRKELQYMWNTIFIKERRVCIKLLRSSLEGIQNVKPQPIIKGHRSFATMVNFFSFFAQNYKND